MRGSLEVAWDPHGLNYAKEDESNLNERNFTVRYDTIRNTNGRRDEGEGDGRWEVAVIANLRGKWVRKAAPKSLLDDAAGGGNQIE